MKKLITLSLLIFIFSCKRMQYQDKFNSYIDSANVYNDKFDCYLKCNKIDSMHYAIKIGNRFTDSIHKYYLLIHPNSTYVNEKSVEINKCNCK